MPAPSSPTGPIVSFGSINVDLAAYSVSLPRPGETVHADRYAMGLGGKGANQAACASRLAAPLGLRVALAGRVGVDPFGVLARERLSGFGVSLDAVRDDPANPTGIALIGIDQAGENAITVAGGANMALDETDIEAAHVLLSGASVLLLQLETPIAASLAAARLAKAGGAVVILDPAPAPKHGLPDEFWHLADLLTPNETETESLVGVRPTDPEQAALCADRMQAKGLRRVIVKLGARGVYYRDGAESGFVTPFAVKSVDSVAAGDCFNGGLAVALAQGRRLADAVRFAAACGALATTRHGAAEAAPTLDEVHALLG
jgi:ribokinase